MYSPAEAHLLGLVHRDIKASNIFLSNKGIEHDFAQVMDFGLVESLPFGIARTGLGGVGLHDRDVMKGRSSASSSGAVPCEFEELAPSRGQ